MDILDKKTQERNWILDQLVFTKEQPNKEAFEFENNNEQIPELSFSAFGNLYKFDNFWSQFVSLHVSTMVKRLIDFLDKIVLKIAEESNKIKQLY